MVEELYPFVKQIEDLLSITVDPLFLTMNQ